MRHIIVEGPDGSGKTGMVDRIHTRLGYPIHERASTSLGGPVPDLAAWVTQDLITMDDHPGPMVYDRHPIISEPIYGTVVRSKPQTGFHPIHDRNWLASVRLTMYPRVVIVFCLPGLHTVTTNVAKTQQMAGVVDNIRELYQSYVDAYRHWGSVSFVWNYGTDDADEVLKLIEEEATR